jgi:hypothetical protein
LSEFASTSVYAAHQTSSAFCPSQSFPNVEADLPELFLVQHLRLASLKWVLDLAETKFSSITLFCCVVDGTQNGLEAPRVGRDSSITAFLAFFMDALLRLHYFLLTIGFLGIRNRLI